MAALRRFYTVMAVFFGLMTVVSGWRVLASDGVRIAYVPSVLALATAVMALQALRAGRKMRETDSENKD